MMRPLNVVHKSILPLQYKQHSLAQRRKDLKRIPEIRFSLSDTQSEQYLHKILDGITTATATASKSGSTKALDQYIDFEEE